MPSWKLCAFYLACLFFVPCGRITNSLAAQGTTKNARPSSPTVKSRQPSRAPEPGAKADPRQIAGVNRRMPKGAAALPKTAAALPDPAEPYYLQVLAQPGDDVPALLARYGLDNHECNVTQFFKLNGLRKEDYRLKQRLKYQIPVQEVEYNGKSIRSTLGITDWQTAKRISDYNEAAVTKKLRVTGFVKDKKLWVPWHELHCPEPDPAATKTVLADLGGTVETPKARRGKNLGVGERTDGARSFPIFGPAFANTPLVDQRLKGRVFYLVSGHGGPDVGAQGKRGGMVLCEDEYAYDVSLRLLRLLLSHGATAYMIVRDPNDGIREEAYLGCDKDEEVWGNRVIPYDQKERLQQRCDVINAFTAEYLKKGVTDQTLIEIHVDSRSHQHKTDVFFYHRRNSVPSEALARRFHRAFLQKYLKVRGQQRYNGTVSTRDLYMLRETTVPVAVYIELANIRNDWDQQRLVIRNNRQALANWLCEALLSE